MLYKPENEKYFPVYVNEEKQDLFTSAQKVLYRPDQMLPG
jgi:hypothetical protein